MEQEQNNIELASPSLLGVMRQIANIAHHGGLLGIKSDNEAMQEIRKLSADWWDSGECARLQLKNRVGA